jgi:hypothetical protein
MYDERRLAETEKNFIKKFKKNTSLTPTFFIRKELSLNQNLAYIFEKFLFLFTLGFIVHLQIRTLRSFKQQNMKLKLGHNVFKILIVNGYLPICIYKYLDEYLRNYTYSNTYRFLTKIENSFHLKKIYSLQGIIRYRKSKYFIKDTNLILCRYFVNYVYD